MTVNVLIRLLDVTLVLGNYVSNVSLFPDISRRRATYANRLTGAWRERYLQDDSADFI